MSDNCFNSTALHEIAEFLEMRKGAKFWKAHNKALGKELKAGFLDDPYTEKY